LPTLSDLARHTGEGSFAAYPVLVFASLCMLEIARSPQTPARPLAGFALLAAALGWQFVCANAEWVRFARPGLPIAVAGLSLWLGRAAGRAALLALFAVPAPSLLLDALDAALGAALFSPALRLLALAGSPLALADGQVSSPSGPALALIPADQGLPLACFAAGLAFRELPRGVAAGRALAALLLAAALGGSLALLASNAALVLLAATGSESAAHFSLRQLPWLVALALAAWRARGGLARLRRERA